MCRMHMMAPTGRGAKQGAWEGWARSCLSALGCGAALLAWDPFSIAWPGGLWYSPWPPPFSAHPAPSPSVSSCRPHSPQWWLQESTRVQSAGEKESPESQGGQGLEPLFPPDCRQPRHWEWGNEFKAVIFPREEKGSGGWRGHLPGPQFANYWQSHGAQCLNFREGSGLRSSLLDV